MPPNLTHRNQDRSLHFADVTTSHTDIAGRSRRRRWAPKVRTGCLTCKIRRVKCDETKPSCNKCISTGRKCDGYEDIKKPNISPNSRNDSAVKVFAGGRGRGGGVVLVTQQQSTSGLEFVPTATPYSVSWVPFYGGEMEKKNFDFFQSITSSALASFYGSEFWSRETLQIAHQYPALFHAITAFGSIHCGYLNETVPSNIPRVRIEGNYVQFGLQEFNKAIRSMYKLIAQNEISFKDQQVILTTCLLFTCLSALQGRQYQAFMHVKTGMRLIQQWRLDNGDTYKANKKTIDMLSLAFMGLDTQVRPYLVGQEGLLQWTNDDIIESSSMDERPFETLFEAYFDLELLFNKLLRLTFPTASTIAWNLDAQTLIYRMKMWDARFAQLLSTICLTASEVDALDSIRLRREWARSIMWPFNTQNHGSNSKTSNSHDEMGPQWLDLIGLAHKVLSKDSPSFVSHISDSQSNHNYHDHHDHHHQEQQQQQKQPVFVLHSTALEVLYFVVSRSRDPVIRRRALRLLQLHPRREGICEGMAATKILGKIIEIEEMECPRSLGYSSPCSSKTTCDSSSASLPTRTRSTHNDERKGAVDIAVSPSTLSATSRKLPCSEKGKWVCETHRVLDIQYHLYSERQLKVLMWTMEDLMLDKPGRELIVSWW